MLFRRFGGIRATACAVFGFVGSVSLAQTNTPQSGTSRPQNESLLERRPVDGYLWDVIKSAVIGGQVFDVGGRWRFGLGTHDTQAVFDNRDGYAAFEAFVGWRGTGEHDKGTLQFVVLGDGKELARSPQMRDSDAPYRLYTSINGKRGVTLKTVSDDLDGFAEAIWATPKFVQAKPSAEIGSQPGRGSSNTASDSDRSDAAKGTKVLRLDPEKLEDLATKLRTAVSEDSELSKGKPRLAVATFGLIPAEDLAPSNAANVREDLTTALINTKAFSLVERGQLDQALKELKLNLSDTFDSTKAQQLGKLIGARLVLIGSISDRDGKYTVINARLIDTQTGEIHSAARVEIRQ